MVSFDIDDQCFELGIIRLRHEIFCNLIKPTTPIVRSSRSIVIEFINFLKTARKVKAVCMEPGKYSYIPFMKGIISDSNLMFFNVTFQLTIIKSMLINQCFKI